MSGTSKRGKQKFKKYSTKSSRLLATLIDIGVLLPVFYGLQYLANDQFSVVNLGIMVFLTFCPSIYSICFESIYGQTLGKMILYIEVLDIATEQKISRKQAVHRVIVPSAIWALTVVLVLVTGFISLVLWSPLYIEKIALSWDLPAFSLWYLSDILIALFDKRGVSLHDKISGTIVVKIDRHDTSNT